MAIPTGEDGKRLIRGAITAMQRNPRIAECERTSVFTSLLTCAQLALQLDGREAHLVPFRNRDGKLECVLIPDYKGLARLVMQSGNVTFIHTDVVRENDRFGYDRGQITMHQIDFRKPRGEVYAVYALARFKDGAEKAEVMSVDEVEEIRRGSQGADGKAWKNNWSEMAKKTVFKRLSKWLPLSASASEAVTLDNNVETTRGFVDVDAPEISTELPKREERAPRAAIGAAEPPQAQTVEAQVTVDAAPPAPPAPPAPAKPKVPRRSVTPAAPATPPPPPPAPAGEEEPFIVSWMNANKVTTMELEKALADYMGEDVQIDNVLRLADHQIEFIRANAEALVEAIKNGRVPL